MSTTSHQVLQLLTSGEYLSGEVIGRRLGVSRMAVSKAVKRLGDYHVPVSSVSGRGYRLQRDMQLFDRDRLEQLLALQEQSDCQLHILESVASTSDHLLGMTYGSDTPLTVCLTEKQAQGRGRRERGWVATPYRNITMSMAWQFENGMADLAGLGVAAGIAIVQTLHSFGMDPEIGLKWPNDIVWQGRKLGGLLIDIRGEHDGPCRAVLGLGLNLSLSQTDADTIDQPYTTLETIQGETVDRNALAAALIASLARMFERYSDTGFSAWHEQWVLHDRLRNRQVVVISRKERLTGTALGIDEQGALLLRLSNGEIVQFYSGEVSLRSR